jgi:hypothetical protein
MAVAVSRTAVAAAAEDAGGCFTMIFQAACCELPKELPDQVHDLVVVAAIKVPHNVHRHIGREVPAATRQQ